MSTAVAYDLFEIAELLRAIPGVYPKTVDAMAQLFVEWCKGGVFQDEYWTPQRQAHFLVTTAMEYQKWPGSGKLWEAYIQRFPPTDQTNPTLRTIDEIAQVLFALPGVYPKTVEAVTRLLKRWCEGGEYEGEHWTPTRQAWWLIIGAVQRQRWEGPGVLLDRYCGRFPPPINKALDEDEPKYDEGSKQQSLLF